MEREIRTWWSELNRADQDAWISAWEGDMISPELAWTLPSAYVNQWTAGEEPRRPGPKLADFLEQQAAGRFLNSGQQPAHPSRMPTT
jgi:hypothetical protein